MGFRLSLEKMIQNCVKIHKGLYDYSLIREYVGAYEKYPIICTICKNTFYMSYRLHTKDKCGCGVCNTGNKGAPNFVEYYLPKLIEIYGDLYDFSKVVGNPKSSDKIPVGCSVHGFVNMVLGNLISNHSECIECVRERRGLNAGKLDLPTLRGIVKSDSKSMLELISTEYSTNKDLLEFKCLISGDTYLRKWNVYTKYRTCSCEYCVTVRRRETAVGWSRTRWVEYCTLNNLESFLYILFLSNGGESFYKVGITTNVTKRLGKINSEGYVPNVLSIFKGDHSTIFTLEKKLHKKFKKNTYVPIVQFGGYTECFSNIDGILDHIPFNQVEVITDLVSQKEVAA